VGTGDSSGAVKDHIPAARAVPHKHPMPGGIATAGLSHPHLHLRRTDSTNERARALAIAGAPHGTLVTAEQQTAGRGRQGRSWSAPPGRALLCSLVLRDPPALLSLLAGVAVCDAVGERARVKWPNDVVFDRPARDPSPDANPAGAHDGQSSPGGSQSAPPLAKLAGILVESRPQERWAVLGIGINVAVSIDELPAELRERAASLDLPRDAIEPTLARLIEALERRLDEPARTVLDAWRARDALFGREVFWAGGQGLAHGVDDAGRLVVGLRDGAVARLDAGEVHLGLV
jgi:BirA family biotin operon repressor/biotin-[acetyl-CoA-carboxylase] ligase